MNTADIYTCKTRAMGDDREFLATMTGGVSSSAGVLVNHRTALSHNPVWSAVQRISGDIAKLPFNMFERLSDDTREMATNHPTQRVIRRKPNSLTSAFRFWRTLMYHALLWNRSYAWIERNSMRQCVGLYNLPPDRVHPEFNEETQRYDYYRVSFTSGEQALLDAGQILDIAGMQYDHSDMIDITLYARDNWGQGMAGNQFVNKFFANGVNAGGILMVPPETKPQSATNLIEAVESRNKGTENAFKALVLRDGAQWVSTTVKPVDAQMAELLAQNVKDVARWFNIPASKLNADDSGVYGSREADARDYLDSCLSPWLTNISAQCWLKLLTTDSQRRDRYYFEHNTAALLATEVEAQYKVLQMGIQTGLLSPNEGRKMLNLNPRDDGFGDLYYFSNNMQPATEEAIYPTEPDPVETEPVEPTDSLEPAQTDEVAEEVERQFERDVARLAARTRTTVRRNVNKHGPKWFTNANNIGDVYERLYGDIYQAGRAYALITGQDLAVLADGASREYIDNLMQEIAE